MENIKIKAWESLIKFGLSSLPVDIMSLNPKDVGFKIYPYSTFKDYIDKMNLTEYAKEHKGFTIKDNNKIIIFYNDNLSFSERYFVIAHEIGHIVLGHTICGKILGKSNNLEKDNLQETEADTFAYAFLAPAPILVKLNIVSPPEISRITNLSVDMSKTITLEVINEFSFKEQGIELQLIKTFSKYINKFNRRLKYKKINFTPILLCLSLFFLSSTIYFANANKKIYSYELENIIKKVNNPIPSIKLDKNIYTENEVPQIYEEIKATEENNNKIVFITKTGKKYHTQDCGYVKGKNPLSISIEDAEKLNLDPCLKCKPKEEN